MKSSIRRQSKRRLNKRGHVLVWALIIMPIALGAAGFATDLGNWYLQIQRIQRAADAAALAGDPYLPSDFANAKKAALEELKKNKLTPDEVNGAVIQVAPGKPTALRVQVKRTVPNQFISIIGGGKFATFSRDATADHSEGLHLGNGSNVLGGYEPGPVKWGDGSAQTGGYYLQIAAGNARKIDGDRIMSRRCSIHPSYGNANAYATKGISGCSSFPGGTNLEHNSEGYTYRVNVIGKPGGGMSQLIIQSYDPGFAKAGGGNACTNEPNTGINVPMWENGTGCTSEDAYNSEGLWDTIYGLYETSKSTTPITTCRTYAPTANASASLGQPGFEWIHQWSTVCDPITVDTSKDSTYFLRVKSSAVGDGTNGFALRAGLSPTNNPSQVNVPLSQTSVKIEADVHVSMFNSIGDGPQTFALTQVNSQWANSPINFQFFDTADVREKLPNGKRGKLMKPVVSIVQADGSPVPGSCAFAPPGASSETTIGNCSVTIGGTDYQGQYVNFKWNVPSDYSCTPSSKFLSGGCWVFVRMTYPGSVSVQDNSTWSLDQPDKPLRLIE